MNITLESAQDSGENLRAVTTKNSHGFKQVKTLLPPSAAARLAAAPGLLTRKYDGITATRTIGDAVIVGEWVTPKSGGFFTAADRARFENSGHPARGFFAAFTVASITGENLLHQSTRTRWAALQRYARAMPPDMLIVEQVTDIAAVLAAGAEGVCWHDWDAPWGEMHCIKARWEGICRVTGHCGGTQSVFIERQVPTGLTGLSGSAGNTPGFNPVNLVNPVYLPAGKVALLGGRCDLVKEGSLIKVTGLCLTDDGKIREPRPDNDTPTSWLVKF